MRFTSLIVLLVACTQPRSKLCKEICAKEYECATSTPGAIVFDEKECVAACAVLEADQDYLAKVQKHAECVRAHAQQCGEMLAKCQ